MDIGNQIGIILFFGEFRAFSSVNSSIKLTENAIARVLPGHFLGKFKLFANLHLY